MDVMYERCAGLDERRLDRRHGPGAGQVMTPMDVLVSATRVNAELFRREDRIGTVEPGKDADLLVIDGNPLRDLRGSRTRSASC